MLKDLTISVGIPNVPLFVPEQARQALGVIAMDTLRLALSLVAGHVSDEAGKFADTGALAQSFGSDPATERGGMEVIGADVMAGVTGRVFSSLPYAIVMEDGRRVGAPISQAGIDAIGLWARRKLGLSEEDADRAKYAIANHIVKSGIPGKHYAEAGFNAAKPQVELMFADLGRIIGETLTGRGQVGAA